MSQQNCTYKNGQRARLGRRCGRRPPAVHPGLTERGRRRGNGRVRPGLLTRHYSGGSGSRAGEGAVPCGLGAGRVRRRGHAGPVPGLWYWSRSGQGSRVGLRRLGVTGRLGLRRRRAGVLLPQRRGAGGRRGPRRGVRRLLQSVLGAGLGEPRRRGLRGGLRRRVAGGLDGGQAAGEPPGRAGLRRGARRARGLARLLGGRRRASRGGLWRQAGRVLRCPWRALAPGVAGRRVSWFRGCGSRFFNSCTKEENTFQ